MTPAKGAMQSPTFARQTFAIVFGHCLARMRHALAGAQRTLA